jgi:hypothetical protein
MSTEGGHAQLEHADQPIRCGRCGSDITGGGAGKLCAICLRIWEQTRVPRENWWISSSSQWFVRRADKQLGPYAFAALSKLAVDGRLRAADLIWTEGVTEWRRADRIHGLLLSPEMIGAPRPAAEIHSAVTAVPIAAVSTATPTAIPTAARAATPTATPTAIPTARPAAPRIARPNYFVRHWRGQLALPVSYWVNWLLIGALLAVGVLSATDPALLEHLGTNAGNWVLAIAASALAVMAWQSVGLWRSADRYVAAGGKREWATLAKVCVGVGLLPVAGLALQQLPAVQQTLVAPFAADLPRVTQLYVANRGTEIEIAGGMSSGIAAAFSSTLDRTPSIRVVRLANAGGSISEAHKLAGLIAARELVTFAPHECDGACLLAFLGGKLRYLGLGGRLGFYGASVGTGGAGGKRNQLFREVMLARGVPTAFIEQALAAVDSHPWYPTTSELLQAHVITGIADDPAHAAQEFYARARLEADFLTVPVFAVLRQLEPDTFAQLKETYVSGVLGGVPRNEMNAKLHAAIMEKVIPKYVRIAPDHELVAYWRTQLDKARELQAIDPKYCAQFLTPQPGVDTSSLAGLFSQKVQDEDIQALANLIRAGAEHPGRVPPGSEVREALRASARRADALIPGAVDIVANPQTASTLPREFCGAEVAFYESILALPPAQAGPLLRFLVAQG